MKLVTVIAHTINSFRKFLRCARYFSWTALLLYYKLHVDTSTSYMWMSSSTFFPLEKIEAQQD